jgi:GNAT superfamily N-acetyltransferase
MVDGELTRTCESWTRGRYGRQEWKKSLDRLAPFFLEDSLILGAYDSGSMAGCAILGDRFFQDGLLQFVFLYVSRRYRRQGISTEMARLLIARARSLGASGLYVSACPSTSAVSFYLKLGFVPTERYIKDLYDLEPEDIHMTLTFKSSP